MLAVRHERGASRHVGVPVTWEPILFGVLTGATYLFAVRLGRRRENARVRRIFWATQQVIFGGTTLIMYRCFEEETTTEEMQDELKQLMEEREKQR